MNSEPEFVISARRAVLAAIAQSEATLGLEGDVHLAGTAIEKYLALFRGALNRNCESDRYSDIRTGYPWCCAFVYWCCREAGFTFPPKPVEAHRFTLAAVPAWKQWAEAEGFFFAVGTVPPEPGDLVLFNGVTSPDQPLDHIGVVIERRPGGVLSAEGNVENRAGLFERGWASVAGYVRLPERFAEA